MGSKLRESILPATAKVDNFQKTLKLSSKDVRVFSQPLGERREEG